MIVVGKPVEEADVVEVLHHPPVRGPDLPLGRSGEESAVGGLEVRAVAEIGFGHTDPPTGQRRAPSLGPRHTADLRAGPFG